MQREENGATTEGQTKLPQPGEYWRQRDGQIAYVVGRRPECDGTSWPLIVVDLNGVCRESLTADGLLDEFCNPCDEDLIEHLPDCTGWDWVPETWPKWYVLDLTKGSCNRPWAIERYSTTKCWRHGFDENDKPTKEHTSFYSPHLQSWLEVTEAEAKARLTPPEVIPSDVYYCSADANFYHTETRRGMGNHFYEKWKLRWAEFPDKYEVLAPILTCPDCAEPVTAGHEDVCPMAWVEISKALHPDHVPRIGIDVLLERHTANHEAKTATPFKYDVWPIIDATWDYWKFVCRRKDLPPVPAKTKIPLRVFVSKNVSKGTYWPTLFVSINDSPDGTNYTEVHGLNLYIEDPH